MAQRRLQYEYEKFVQEPANSKIRAGPLSKSNFFDWWAIIVGPTGTPYEGGVFNINVHFPTEYPFKPPTLRFETKVFHPNISRKGAVCVDILQKEWWPALTTAKVLLSVSSLLASPNLEAPVDAVSAHLYVENYTLYEETARQWTQRYAKNKSFVSTESDSDSDDQ